MVKPACVGVGEQAGDEQTQPAFALTGRVGLGRRGGDERTDTALGFDHASPFELGVDPGNGVGVDLQIHRQLANGRQLVARAQAAGGDRRAQATFELRVDRRRVALIDGNDIHVRLPSYCSNNLVH